MSKVDKAFEKLPFADELANWKHLPAGSSEPDTELESELAFFLNDWVDQPDKVTAQKLKSYESIFQAAKSEFPKVFMPPVGDSAFRGMSFPYKKVVAWVKKSYKENSLKLVPKYRFKYYTSPNYFSYVGNKPVQSWTTDFEVAETFSANNVSNELIHIILETTIDDSFIFNPIFMNKIYTDVIGDDSYENEVICFKKQMKVKIYVQDASLKKIINNKFN